MYDAGPPAEGHILERTLRKRVAHIEESGQGPGLTTHWQVGNKLGLVLMI